MQSEVWCDVEGYVGRYQVSDMGRLRSVPFHQRTGSVVAGHTVEVVL